MYVTFIFAASATRLLCLYCHAGQKVISSARCGYTKDTRLPRCSASLVNKRLRQTYCDKCSWHGQIMYTVYREMEAPSHRLGGHNFQRTFYYCRGLYISSSTPGSAQQTCGLKWVHSTATKQPNSVRSRYELCICGSRKLDSMVCLGSAETVDGEFNCYSHSLKFSTGSSQRPTARSVSSSPLKSRGFSIPFSSSNRVVFSSSLSITDHSDDQPWSPTDPISALFPSSSRKTHRLGSHRRPF